MNFHRISLVACLAFANCVQSPPIEPVPAAPQINLFKVSAASVARGAKVTLEWDTADAPTVEITQLAALVGPVPGVDNQSAGTVEVTISEQTLFVLSATNGRGVRATALATVAVEGTQALAFFAAVPETIGPGESSSLLWNAPGAKKVTITPSVDLQGQRETGSVQVSPAATTVFTLDADGVKREVTVAVTQTVRGFTVSKTLALPGEMVKVSWETVGASKLVLSSPGRGALVTETDPAKVASGSFNDTLPDAPLGTSVPYLLSVEGKGAPQTRTISVVLSNAPEIKTFTAPKYGRTGQKFAFSWTTANTDLVELSSAGTVFWTSTSHAQATSGTLLLDTPTAVTEFTLTAKNARGGAPVSKKVTLSPVGGVSVMAFTALPSTVATGGTAVTLSWNVPNARRLRILGSDGHTVATARDAAAETGTATAFPNGPITYTLDADNTLEAPVTANQTVAVTAPATFGPASAAAVFAGNPVSLAWSVGSQLVGLPHTTVVPQAGSTGFLDISTTGTKLVFAGDDDATKSFTPADFETFLFGNRLSGPITVSTNGFFVFGSSALTRAVPQAIPNAIIEPNFLAPFWADLRLGDVGGVYWELIGEAPERVLVVQFDKVKLKADPMSELTFQARVHQTGVVTFEYKKLSATPAPTGVVGIEGIGVGLAAGGAVSSLSLTFFGPVTSPQPITFDSLRTVGGFIKLTNGYLKASYTPGAFVGRGQVAISEVLYDPNAAIATTGEWFEVSNSSSTSVDLNGWTIDFGGGQSHTIGASLVVAANSTVVLGQSAGGVLNDSVSTAYQYGTALSMPQPTGSLVLQNVNYQSSAAWNSALANNGGTGVSSNIDAQPFLSSTDPSGTAAHAISCSSTTAFGGQSPSQLGSPGTLKSCFGYAMQSIPVSFFDISAGGTTLFPSSTDEVVAAVTFSPPISYFGVNRASGTVSSNGWLVFKSTTSSAGSNRTKPDTAATNAGTVAPFWDDLAARAGGGTYVRRIAAGADPSNPIAHWIVQWTHFTFWTTTDDLNFQVKFFDNGVIEYHYATMTSGSSSNYASGNGATVWLENTAGNTALVSSINQPKVVPNSALRFTPN
jgi:hypothetical protein